MLLRVEVKVYVILFATRTDAHPDRDHDITYIGTRGELVLAKRYAEEVTNYDEWHWHTHEQGHCYGFHPEGNQAVWIIEETL